MTALWEVLKAAGGRLSLPRLRLKCLVQKGEKASSFGAEIELFLPLRLHAVEVQVTEPGSQVTSCWSPGAGRTCKAPAWRCLWGFCCALQSSRQTPPFLRWVSAAHRTGAPWGAGRTCVETPPLIQSAAKPRARPPWLLFPWVCGRLGGGAGVVAGLRGEPLLSLSGCGLRGRAAAGSCAAGLRAASGPRPLHLVPCVYLFSRSLSSRPPV